jgi:16S rRNA C967 or C1407 C5-methylase (RsmB/RsmF family)/NOL1/NOP2/fmu family ribosome biogenesis protein
MTALNPQFIEQLRRLGPDYDGLEQVICNTAPSVSVRINRAKGAVPPQDAEPVAWCADGFYLPERPQFTLDPALHQGRYYPQDASSMAVAQAVAQAVAELGPTDGPLRYLDACAAPGGKTTAAISALPANSFVVANEFDPRRASVLVENLAKWGVGAPVVTRGDAAAISGLDDFYDIIAADVPCSGEGMMRKDATACEQWSPSLVAECASRQLGIVDALWRALRSGGYFIYSTCTFNPAENERIVAHLVDECGAESVAVPALDVAGVAHEVEGASRCYRFIPGRVRGEGQFVAMLRKDGNSRPMRVKDSGDWRRKAPVDYLDGEFMWRTGADGTIMAAPAEHAALIEAVARRCHIVNGGIEVGTVKGRDIVPAQALALSTSLRREAFAIAEVGLDDALTYLRRDAIAVDAPRGIVLLTYAGNPLGFIKNLGNRANNLYPANWRIRQ